MWPPKPSQRRLPTMTRVSVSLSHGVRPAPVVAQTRVHTSTDFLSFFFA